MFFGIGEPTKKQTTKNWTSLEINALSKNESSESQHEYHTERLLGVWKRKTTEHDKPKETNIYKGLQRPLGQHHWDL